MPLNIVVLICEDPITSHRPVEALRIALGLSTGPNPITIVFMGKARLLLTEDTSEVIDTEILEKHLPVIQELDIPLLLPEGSEEDYTFDPELSISKASILEISTTIAQANKVLVF